MSISIALFIVGSCFLFGFFSSLAISSLVVLIKPSLTVRTYRKIFLHYANITSAFFGLIMVVSHYNDSHLWQEYILIIGAFFLFIGSFYFSLLRRKSIMTPLIWGFLVFSWSYLLPIAIG